MLRFFIACLTVMVVGMRPADAQSGRQIDATPFSHEPCSVLDGQPCTPSFCTVFNHWPCIPDLVYPIDVNMQLTIESVPSRDEAANYQKPYHDLASINKLFVSLRFSRLLHQATY